MKLLLFIICILTIVQCSLVNSIGNENILKENEVLSLGVRDSTFLSDNLDVSNSGVFGRKIIYRDLSATKAELNVSGKVSIKICINRAGLVTYAELLGSESTIRDNEILRKYLTAAKGYKFQPDLTAPKEQCGKLNFIISSSKILKNGNTLF